jgi:hypothetical protein
LTRNVFCKSMKLVGVLPHCEFYLLNFNETQLVNLHFKTDMFIVCFVLR